MRVLLIHQFYTGDRGAMRVVRGVERSLAASGHESIVFAATTGNDRSNPWSAYFAEGFRRGDVRQWSLSSKLRRAAAGIYSVHARERLRTLVMHAGPDVALVFKPEYQLSFSVVDELRSLGVPFGLWFVDYRLWCTHGHFYSPSTRAPCFRCANGAHWNAVRHGCGHGSVAMAVYGAVARSVWQRLINPVAAATIVVVPAESTACLLEEVVGVPRVKLMTVPHPLEDEDFACREGTQGEYFFFGGQLVWEKGVHVLIEALASVPDVACEIHGIDPVGLGGTFARLIAERGLASRVRLGTELRHGPEYLRRLAGAAAVVVPSQCPDTSDYAMLEAMAAGKAVVVGDRGGNAEYVRASGGGVVFSAGDPRSLGVALRELLQEPQRARELGRKGRAFLVQRHASGEFGRRLDAALGRLQTRSYARSTE